MMDAPLSPLDITSAAFKSDPHAILASWRSKSPVVQVRLQGPARGADKAFLVARYADVSALLRDPRLAKDPVNAGLPPPTAPGFLRPLFRNMLALDDPDHARLKRLVQVTFTPRRIALMQARTEEISMRMIDRLVRKQRFDLIRDYALPLPVAVISDMLGVPEPDRARFARWSAALIEGGASGWAMLRSLPQVLAFLGYLKRLIAAKRAAPVDDLVSDLVRQEAEGDRLDEAEMMAMVGILLSAGHETTTNLIANGMVALLDQPEAAEALRARPDLMETGVEELLRFAGPVATSTHRYAREEIAIAGVVIPRGALVLGLIGSANRDAAQFEAADRLIPERRPNRHLTFGEGGHYCVGAALARMEGRVAFQHLLERFPGLRLDGGREALVHRPGLVLTGFRRCPVMTGQS